MERNPRNCDKSRTERWQQCASTYLVVKKTERRLDDFINIYIYMGAFWGCAAGMCDGLGREGKCVRGIPCCNGGAEESGIGRDPARGFPDLA